MKPEIRFTIFKEKFFIRFINIPVALLRINHHNVEPKNNPNTTIKIVVVSSFKLEIPSPEKIAKKDKMVTGFVTVKKNVETYAEKALLLFALADVFDGFETKIFSPKYNKKHTTNKMNPSLLFN